jgi:hypothetical protein
MDIYHEIYRIWHIRIGIVSRCMSFDVPLHIYQFVLNMFSSFKSKDSVNHYKQFYYMSAYKEY